MTDYCTNIHPLLSIISIMPLVWPWVLCRGSFLFPPTTTPLTKLFNITFFWSRLHRKFPRQNVQNRVTVNLRYQLLCQVIFAMRYPRFCIWSKLCSAAYLSYCLLSFLLLHSITTVNMWCIKAREKIILWEGNLHVLIQKLRWKKSW